MPQNNIPKYKINEVTISAVPKSQLNIFLTSLIAKNKHVQLITFNLDFLRIADESQDFKDICNFPNYSIPDGYGIVNLVKKKYGLKIDRVTGSDIFIHLLEIAARDSLRVAFLGSSEKTLKALKFRINNDFPNLKIAGAYSPELFFEKKLELNNKLIQEIKLCKPNILFVALGCPRQELWLSKYSSEIGCNICVGVGSVFEFYGGFRKRAPIWIQNLYMEWFWRLMNEPIRLFKRYIYYDLPLFVKYYFFGSY